MNELQKSITSKIDKAIALKKKGLSIVFTNGCFDILHPGHIDYLNKTKNLGDFLVVGLNSDESVKRLKGNDRPINDLTFRTTMLESLEMVDLVIPFEEDTPLNLILKLQPNILAKGGDYTVSEIVGADAIKTWGGKTTVIPFLEGYSSSSIIRKIKSLS